MWPDVHEGTLLGLEGGRRWTVDALSSVEMVRFFLFSLFLLACVGNPCRGWEAADEAAVWPGVEGQAQLRMTPRKQWWLLQLRMRSRVSSAAN